MRIDVVSDIVCPWCYIGKRQLDDALATWSARHPGSPAAEIFWHPFQLNPDFPDDGMPRADYLLAKFGSPDGGPGYQRVVAAAAAAGLEFHPELIQVQPKTLRAHSLIQFADPGAQQHALAGMLFQAYFIEGANLCEQATLERIGRAAGLADERIADALAEPALATVADADRAVRGAGISGVPFFIVDRKLAVSGAQGSDALLQAFEQASAAG
jgi:predicted DsbA family dithiol-disulfide isomerase